jgi:hypothetical protein
MKTSEYIDFKLDRLPRGYIFTYEDFIDGVNNREAVIKALNRMVAVGKIGKLAKGRYYKPENTVFGNLVPDQYQVVKDLIGSNGKPIGYLTGYSIFSSMGLTTQVSNTIQIGKNEIRPSFKRGRYRISFIKQKNKITKENIPQLQILDAIRYIKRIPDISIDIACKRILAIIRNLSDDNRNALARLALKYPPATRALLGAMLESLVVSPEITAPLQKSLNPITSFKMQGIDKVLPFAKKWNIK